MQDRVFVVVTAATFRGDPCHPVCLQVPQNLLNLASLYTVVGEPEPAAVPLALTNSRCCLLAYLQVVAMTEKIKQQDSGQRTDDVTQSRVTSWLHCRAG